jgi:hypothetical protein
MTSKVEPHGRIVVVINEEGFVDRDTGPAWLEVNWPEPNTYKTDEVLKDNFGTSDIKSAAEQLISQHLKKN